MTQERLHRPISEQPTARPWRSAAEPAILDSEQRGSGATRSVDARPWSRDVEPLPRPGFGSIPTWNFGLPNEPLVNAMPHSSPSTMGVTSMVEHHRQRISATIRKAEPRADADPSQRAPKLQVFPTRWQDARPGAAPIEEAVVGATQAATEIEEPAEGQTVRLPDIRLGSTESETDAVASTLAYNPTVTQAVGQPADSFGETSPYDFSMTGITVTPAAGTFTVVATVDNPITFQVRTTTGPDGQVDIDSDSDSDIKPGNYPTVVSDLTPDMTDLNGRPPRTAFFAKDLTIVHERFHASDGQTHAQNGVTLAQAWLNGQAAANVAAVNALVGQVPSRVIATRKAAMTLPGREERAYADGAPLYTSRATAIQTKGASGQYAPAGATGAPAAAGSPAAAGATGQQGLSRGAKVAIGVGAGALAGAAIGAFGGPVGALVGAGVGAVVGLIGGLLA